MLNGSYVTGDKMNMSPYMPRHRGISSWLDRMEDLWDRALLPQDGQILAQSEMVTKYYRVKYDDDGSIHYLPITKEEAMKSNDSKD